MNKKRLNKTIPVNLLSFFILLSKFSIRLKLQISNFFKKVNVKSEKINQLFLILHYNIRHYYIVTCKKEKVQEDSKKRALLDRESNLGSFIFVTDAHFTELPIPLLFPFSSLLLPSSSDNLKRRVIYDTSLTKRMSTSTFYHYTRKCDY